MCGLVEHEDGAHRGRLALRGRQPALRELRQARRVGDGEDDVVLLDDALVEAVGLLVGEAEGGLEDRLLPQALDLERRAEREVREDPDGDEHRRAAARSSASLSRSSDPAMSPRVISSPALLASGSWRALMRSGSVTMPCAATNSANCSAMYVSGVALGLGEGLAVERVEELDRAEEAARVHAPAR